MPIGPMLLVVAVSLTLSIRASAFLSPIQSNLLGVPEKHHYRHEHTAIHSSAIPTDPEEIIEEEFIYAPVQDFTSEADTASQANLLAQNGQIEIQKEIEQSFLQYALSIILGRALPDARDGLKPVHRRILFAMNELKLDASSPHRKCARVVGEVLGKFHPHGDMAVYDALVRMAQDFSTNMPLIDGHGNFGSIDADPAAAMRYTECRLTKVAQESLLEDLYEDTVDFVPNFDGNEVEPTVLPAKLPILLLNGCSGIAVGMATNVPPHNLRELMAACNAILAERKDDGTAIPLSDAELFRLVPAPDFPTGATILGTSGAKQLYSTGNGGIQMRAETQIETVRVSKSQTRTAIIVTSLPYQVNKSLLLEKIADLVNDKKLEGIADLRDESDRDGIRVVIELKRDAVAAVVLNNLYKKTPLQTSFSGNFLALMGSGTKPQRFTLRSALECFLDFRFDTIRRRSAHLLDKVETRTHIVEGLLKALLCIDEADAVLRLQLGQLTRLNKDKLEDERNDLKNTEKNLQRLLTVDQAVRDLITEENNALSDKFGVDRRSKIEVDDAEELNDMDLIKNSRSVIVVTRSGYIKRMALVEFESQNRGTRGKRGISDGKAADNEIAHCFTCNDHDTLLMVTQKGIAYGLRAYQVPTATRTAKGTPIPAVLPINADDTINSILPVSEFSEEEYIVVTTEQGWIKKTSLAAFDKLSSRGLTIATLEDGDRLVWSLLCKDGDDVLIGTKHGMATRFESSKLRATGRTSRGVHAMKLKAGDAVADMNVLNGDAKVTKANQEYVLAVTSQGYGKRVPTTEFRTQARGGLGVVAIKFKASASGRDFVTCLRTVKEDDEVLVITAKGVIVRQQVKNISSQGRTATGVLVQKLDAGDHITSVSLVPKYDETDATRK
ncbi:DNA Topoisomerase IV [Fragilaria crotonensis]|nr:DNA Topoisomerase IV [Fragilaria crotonensis]